jgi:hypothetical protein
MAISASQRNQRAATSEHESNSLNKQLRTFTSFACSAQTWPHAAPYARNATRVTCAVHANGVRAVHIPCISRENLEGFKSTSPAFSALWPLITKVSVVNAATKRTDPPPSQQRLKQLVQDYIRDIQVCAEHLVTCLVEVNPDAFFFPPSLKRSSKMRSVLQHRTTRCTHMGLALHSAGVLSAAHTPSLRRGPSTKATDSSRQPYTWSAAHHPWHVAF